MKKILLCTLCFLPLGVAAQSNLGSLISSVGYLINILLPITFGLALLYFFWGLANFILKSGSGEREEGKTKMVWGVIALFVMASVWGIVQFIADAFLIDTAVNQVDSSLEIDIFDDGGFGSGSGDVGGGETDEEAFGDLEI